VSFTTVAEKAMEEVFEFSGDLEQYLDWNSQLLLNACVT